MTNSILLAKKFCSRFVQIRYATWQSVQTYYDVLGVTKQASLKDIKAAYYKKCKELHPDNNTTDPKAHTKFIRLNKAYSTLSEPTSRKKYDLSMESPTSTMGTRSRYHQYHRYDRRYNYWGDIEFETFYQRANKNREEDEYVRRSEKDMRESFRHMIYLLLFIAALDAFMIYWTYDYDMNELHRKYSPYDQQSLQNIKRQVNLADEELMDRKLRFLKQNSSLEPLVNSHSDLNDEK